MTEKTIPIKREEQDMATTREEERYLKPPVDIYEENHDLVVVCDMPGVAHDGINVSVDNNILTISGKVNHTDRNDEIYREFRLMSFFRQFELSEEVDQEKITAELKNGVLRVVLPKMEKVKPKKIQISVT